MASRTNLHVEIRQERANSPAARALIAALDADISARLPGNPIHGIDIEAFEAAGGLFFILYADGTPAACGALRPLDATATEVKRMFVLPQYRGQGLSRKMLAHLEFTAANQGYPTMRLETGQAMHEALGLYRSGGWTEIPKYGEYVGSAASVCFEKWLDASRCVTSRL